MEDKSQVKRDIVINGRFLTKRLEGIPRYVHEVLREIDKYDEFARRVIVVVPSGCNGIVFENIQIVRLPKVPLNYGVLWDVFRANVFAGQKNYGLYVSMGPGLSCLRNSLITHHDIRPLTFDKDCFSFKNCMNKAKFVTATKLSTLIGNSFVTVSHTAEQEINNFFGKKKVVDVIGNGWEHIKQRETDNSVFEKYSQIRIGEYYLAISSIAPHKNFKWIVENAKKNPDKQYVIVGGTNPKLWTADVSNFKDNIIYLGFQSDEVLKALLVHAKALISPSLYEGFGIPPLEALACGTRVIVSDIPVYREIYGDAVAYLDPHDASLDLDSVDWDKDRSAEIKRVLETYTWKNAAKKWINLMERISK